MIKKTAIILTAIMGIMCIGGCADTKSETAQSDNISDNTANQSEKTQITVYAAASLEAVLNDEIALYNETHPDVNISLSAGSSGDLKDAIVESQGVDVDIFFSAATDKMDELVDANLVDSNNVVSLLKNEVVLIGAKNYETKVTGFDNITLASSIALADETVPVGAYSREIFDSLDISLDDFEQINTCSDVSAVKEAVKEGSNEVGTVYYSDYYSVQDEVNLIEIADQSLYSACIYPIAMVNNPSADAQQQEATKEFFDFLISEEAAQLYTDYKFTLFLED